MKREIINLTKNFVLSFDSGRQIHRKYDVWDCGIPERSADADRSTASREHKKIYTVDRLSDHLAKGISDDAQNEYLRIVRRMAPKEPVIRIDDSGVIKPEGYHFESLGIVRDGSRSTQNKSVYCKGYHVTEACVLTDSSHPVSIFG